MLLCFHVEEEEEQGGGVAVRPIERMQRSDRTVDEAAVTEPSAIVATSPRTLSVQEELYNEVGQAKSELR